MAFVPLAVLPLLGVPQLQSPARAATPLASEAFVPFMAPAAASSGGESLSGLGGAETFDPVARAQLLAVDLPLTWSGVYQSFDNSQTVNAELRLASARPMGQMIDLRGELTVGGVTTPVQGNLNAESDQLDLLVLCQCDVAGLELGGVFTGLEGLQLSGWQAPRLTSRGGRLDLRPVSTTRTATSRNAYGSGSGAGSGSAVRGLW
nr:hypothetical protein [Cyanobium sp. FACHB-13342]